jgi:hypothetical protein
MRSVLLIFTLVVAGCVPWPHREQIVPAVSGVITIDGRPAQGVDVYLHEDMRGQPPTACGPSENATVTAEDGRFRFESIRRTRMFLAVGDWVSPWALCMGPKGNTVGFRHLGFGPGPDGNFRCDLQSTPEESGWGYGICKRDDV